MKKLILFCLFVIFLISCSRNGEVGVIIRDLSLENLRELPSEIPLREYADLTFVNGRTGFAITNSGEILKTIDAGRQWDEQRIVGASFVEVSFPTPNIGFISGRNEDGAILLKTIDAGTTWRMIKLPFADEQPTGTHFIDQNKGFIVFRNGVYYTADGGVTWIKQTDITGYNYRDVYFKNEETGFITTYNNGFLKTTNGGLKWTFVSSEKTAMDRIFNAIDRIVCINDNNFLIDLEDNKQIAVLPDGVNKILYMDPEKCIGIGQHYEIGYLPYGDIYVTNDNWRNYEHRKFKPDSAMNFRAAARVNSQAAMIISNGRLDNKIFILSGR